jgi:adenylate kinase family enzyme
MERIMVMGVSGSGKSTFSKALGEKLNLPVIHLDRVFWSAGWREMPRDQFVAEQERLVTQPRWIIDGNYSGTMDVRLRHADTVIHLDLPVLLCFKRVLMRYRRYSGRTRPDMTEGNPERLTWQFIYWVLTFKIRRRPRLRRRFETLRADQKLIVLRSPKAVRAFLAAQGGRYDGDC